jgi:hypothetical protein
MMKSSISAALYAGLLLTFAQDTWAFFSCNLNSPIVAFRNPQWKCDVCGDYLIGSAPIGCLPQNATVSALFALLSLTIDVQQCSLVLTGLQFDDIPVGPIGNYQKTNWTNFVNVADNIPLPLLPIVKPVSKPKFAKLAAGKTGVLAYDFASPNSNGIGGFLKTMRFACALPLTSIPVGCTITIASTCSVTIDSSGVTTKTTVTTYRYGGGFNSTLASLQPSLPYRFTCLNNTISAKSLLGVPVDLYIDEVLHGSWVSRF